MFDRVVRRRIESRHEGAGILARGETRLGRHPRLPEGTSRCTLYIVHRTQLYLDHELYRALAAAAGEQGTTLSDVVRDRLKRSFAEEPPLDPLAAIEQAIGAWGPRPDLPRTDALVRKLRKGARRRRDVTGGTTDRRR
jgi:hypothetical protein